MNNINKPPASEEHPHRAPAAPVVTHRGPLLNAWALQCATWIGLGGSMSVLSMLIWTNLAPLSSVGPLWHPSGIASVLAHTYGTLVLLLAVYGFLATAMALSQLLMLLLIRKGGCKDCGYRGAQNEARFVEQPMSKWGREVYYGSALLGMFLTPWSGVLVISIGLSFILMARHASEVNALGGVMDERSFDCPRCEGDPEMDVW